MTKAQAVIQILVIEREIKQYGIDKNLLKRAEKAIKYLDLENNQSILECMGFDFLIEK